MTTPGSVPIETKGPIVVSSEGVFSEVRKVSKVGPSSHYFLIPKWWLEYWNASVDGEYWVKVGFDRVSGAFTLTPLSREEVAQVPKQKAPSGV